MDDKTRDSLLIDVVKEMATTSAYMKDMRDDLKEHMRRTHMNEAQIAEIRKHITFIRGAWWLLVGLSGTAAILYKIGML